MPRVVFKPLGVSGWKSGTPHLRPDARAYRGVSSLRGVPPRPAGCHRPLPLHPYPGIPAHARDSGHRKTRRSSVTNCRSDVFLLLRARTVMEVKVSHVDHVKFSIQSRSHTILCDQPAENGGEDSAMTPPELLLASLGSCAAFYAVQY